MALILGVTGPIGSGKSSLSRYLVERHGAIYADADRETHALYAPGTPGFARVVAAFGEGIVGPDGAIDRARLGPLAFGPPSRMEELLTAIGDAPQHLADLLQRWHEELPAEAIAVFETINLLESDLRVHCGAIWLVTCAPETAVRRLMTARGLTQDDAERRLAAAKDWRPYASRAAHIFWNDGSEEVFRAEVDAAVLEILEAHRLGTLAPLHLDPSPPPAPGR